MKKYILTVISFLVVGFTYAQNCGSATFRTEPATFTAEDQVTLFVDVSGCPVLAAKPDLYLWIFVPGGPGPDGVGGNGDFCNGSNPNLKMTPTENANEYSYTFTPVALFDATPAEIGTSIGFIPKAFAACKEAGDQTSDLFLSVEPLVFVEKVNRSFPNKFTADDVVTLYFHQPLTEDEGMKSLTDVYVYTAINGTDADGNDLGWVERAPWDQVANTPELKMNHEGNGVYSLHLVPKDFYPVNPGDKITRIFYKFRSADGSSAIPGGFDNFQAEVLNLE